MTFSYMIYIATVIIATLFAFLAQKYSKYNCHKERDVPNPIFYGLSMIPLIIIMGFRDISVGVDGLSYYNNYLIANNMSFLSYYQNYTTEPGFYLLYRISYLLGDVQWLFLISAALTVIFFYYALSYEISRVNLPLAIFIFSSTQYFYFFGIMRMGIAVAIVAFAYRYLIKSENRYFYFFIFIGAMFHYSAVFGLVLIFLSKNKRGIFRKINILKLTVLIPLSFLLIRYSVYPFLNDGRYQGYIESTDIIGTAFISSIPLLILFSFYFNKFAVESKNYQFYFFLFLIKFITEIFAPIMGIGRMVWYVNLSLCILLPATIRLNKNLSIKILLLIITIMYCIVYSYFAYFGESWRGQHMLPYNFFWSEDI